MKLLRCILTFSMMLFIVGFLREIATRVESAGIIEYTDCLSAKRDRETERDTQTDRDRDRERQKQRERERDRQRQIQRDRDRERQRHRDRDTERERETERQRHRYIYIYIYREREGSSQRVSWYDTKPSDSKAEALVYAEYFALSGPLWPKVKAPDRILSMGRIEILSI